MLHLEKVNEDNVRDILELKTAESQKDFVAANAASMAEAKTAVQANGHVFPFGIYNGTIPVGFLMIGFDTDDEWGNPPAVAKGNYNIWRLMIDERYQKKGYGKEAVRLALEFIRTFPCGPAEKCWLSYRPENKTAQRLYESFGFVKTEEKDGDEIIAVLKLSSI